MKPKIFIGSSTEALSIAYAIQENLQHDALCKPWTQGIFQLSDNTLDNLVNSISKFDFAIFVFQADDVVQIRDHKHNTVRDNVLFELGLFVGGLGKDRVFFFIPKNSEKMHLPSDLLGVEPGHFEVPENDDDLLAALGPFCNRVRRQVMCVSSPGGQEKGADTDVDPSPLKKTAPDMAATEGEAAKGYKKVETGVLIDEFGNYTICMPTTIFWEHRICEAFPGARGVHWIKDGAEAVKRLKVLLREPISFEEARGHGATTEPVWWWRGGRDLAIMHFSSITETLCLMDYQQVDLDKIAVYRGASDRWSFVYVEVKPEKPTGVYDSYEDMISRMIDGHGYAWEEYAEFQGHFITRECYDDGAAIINGELTDTFGSELRVRYLSKYNFIIAPQFSPINEITVDMAIKNILNGMLVGRSSIDDLCSLVKRLPRFHLDY